MLPLSWSYTEEKTAQFCSSPLGRSTFIAYASVPKHLRLRTFLDQMSLKLESPLLIRGVPYTTTRNLPGESWSFASEAVLCSSQFVPSRSLLLLEKRGLKHGFSRETSFTDGKETISQIWKKSRYANSKSLEFLFRQTPTSRDRTFVYYARATREPLAAAFFSRRGKHLYHLERFTRTARAPIGAMESLLLLALRTLFLEGTSEISLGEVPFSRPSHIYQDHYHTTSHNLSLTIPLLKYLVGMRLNYQGLRNFKDKFSPLWRPVCVHSTRNLSLVDLFLLALLTNAIAYPQAVKDSIQLLRALRLCEPTLCPTSSSLYCT